MPKKTEQKVVKQLPVPKERWHVRHLTPSGLYFDTTGKRDPSQFSLWLETEDGYLLIKKSASPKDFEEIAMNWESEYGCSANMLDHRPGLI